MKTMDFSETIAACDLKGGIRRQLMELIRYVSIGEGHFLTLTQGHYNIEIKTCFLRNNSIFMPSTLKKWGAYCFRLVRPSICSSVGSKKI